MVALHRLAKALLFCTPCLLVSAAGVAEAESGRTEKAADDTSPLTQDGPVVTFSGLRVHEDGSSTFRVDITREIPVEFSQDQKTLRFVLKGARVALRNNTHPLRAEYFGSNVLRTKLDNRKTDALLEIRLRSEVQPQHRMMTHAGGATLRIDIPAPPPPK